MERVYENRAIRFRMWLAVAAAAAVLALAGWVGLTRERAAEDTADPGVIAMMLTAIGVLIAIRFGMYGVRAVTTFDIDRTSGDARVSLWRPFGEEAVDTHLDRIVDWSYEVGRQRTKMPLRRFHARIEYPHHRVVFELSPMMELDPVFERMAPEAVAEFETESGRAALRGETDEDQR